MSRRYRQRQAAIEARYAALIPEPDERGQDGDQSDFEMLRLYESKSDQHEAPEADLSKNSYHSPGRIRQQVFAGTNPNQRDRPATRCRR